MPKISATQRRSRRQGFVEAAWRCAARKGYRDMTVDDVCAEAGMSKGAFYGYFASKQQLLQALLDDEADIIDQLMDELADRELTSVERLRRLTKAMLDRGADQARVQVRADLWAVCITERKVAEHLAEIVRGRRVQVRAWVQEAVDAGEVDLGDAPANALASLLLALGDGLMLHSAVDPSGFRWANIGRILDEIFAALGAT